MITLMAMMRAKTTIQIHVDLPCPDQVRFHRVLNPFQSFRKKSENLLEFWFSSVDKGGGVDISMIFGEKHTGVFEALLTFHKICIISTIN